MYMYVHCTVHVHVACSNRLNYFVNTVEPLYCGHHWDPSNCSDFRDVLNSGVVLYRIGTKSTVHIRGVLQLICSTSTLVIQCTVHVCKLRYTYMYLFYPAFSIEAAFFMALYLSTQGRSST